MQTFLSHQNLTGSLFFGENNRKILGEFELTGKKDSRYLIGLLENKEVLLRLGSRQDFVRLLGGIEVFF